MKSKHDEMIKYHLEAIMDEPGAWDKMLDVLYQRAIQKRFRETRILNAWSIEDLARRMDVEPEFVEKLENEVFPNYKISTLQRWARALYFRVTFDMEPQVFENAPVEEEK